MLGTDVDLRFPYLCFCLHFHPDDVPPNSLNVLLSQLFDSPVPACQILLEGKRLLLVIYIIGEEKTFSSTLLDLLGSVPGAMQIKLKNENTDKWEKGLLL